MDKKKVRDNLEQLLDLLSDIDMEPEDREVIEGLIREIEKEVEKG